MHLIILGAGTCIPAEGKSPSGYLVRMDETSMLMDAGPGALARLAAAGVSYRDLEYVLISHLHSDHTLDLVTLLQATNATPEWTRTQPLNLIGCRGLVRFLGRLIKVFPGIAPHGYVLSVSEMACEREVFGDWNVKTALTGHTENSVGFRIQAEGKVLVYSGDAIESENLVRLARNADVFVCECSHPKNTPAGNHLTADAVGRIAQAARVKRLVLTHFYPTALQMDLASQVAESYRGEILCAEDGMELRV